MLQREDRPSSASALGRQQFGWGEPRPGAVYAASHQDAAAGKQSRAVALSTGRHRPGRAEGARLWVINLGACQGGGGTAVSADNQHPTVVECCRCVFVARESHRAVRAERSGSRVVEFGGWSRIAAKPTYDEHSAVRQEGRGVIVTGSGHRAGWAEGAGGRVVEFGRGERGGGVEVRAARDQDTSILEQRRGRAEPDANHRTCRTELTGRGVVELGLLGRCGTPAGAEIPAAGDEHTTVGQQGARVAAAR